MKQIMILFLLIGLLLVSGCAIETNSMNGNTNNNANIDNISSEIVDHKYEANTNEDFVKNIPSSEFFNNTSAFSSYWGEYFNFNDKDLTYMNTVEGTFVNASDVINAINPSTGFSSDVIKTIKRTTLIVIDLSCLKDTNIKCGEKQLDIKKAVDIAVAGFFPAEIPKGYSVSGIQILDPVCDIRGRGDTSYCVNESSDFQYWIYIRGPADNSDRRCHEEYLVKVDNTWNIIYLNQNQNTQTCEIGLEE